MMTVKNHSSFRSVSMSSLSFTVWDRALDFEMSFELDPSKIVSRKEFKNYGEDFRNKLEEVVVETIEYINKIKIENIK